ncbi:MAG TPA: X2-like carbohydrate binding domain-containing protein [Clostridia bacterium]
MKRIIAIMASLMLFVLFTSQSVFAFTQPELAITAENAKEYVDSAVTPTEIKVDKSASTDVTVTLIPNGNNLIEIKNGTGTLVRDTDYTMAGSIVVIKKGYLNYYFSKFPEQNLNLSFLFSSGNTVKCCIYTGSSPIPSISPSETSFVLGVDEDIAVKTELNGNYISSVMIEGGIKLIPRIDYTYSVTDKKIIIRKSFLYHYFNGSLNPAKLLINFTGGASIPLTIFPLYPELPHNQLSPQTATFPAGMAWDVAVTRSPGGITLKGITFNSKTLTDGKDYTVTGDDKVILKASFLNTLPEGTATLVFNMKQGNDVNFNIKVTKPQVTIDGITVTYEYPEKDTGIITLPISIKGVTSSTPIKYFDFKMCYDENAVDVISITPGDIIPNPGVNFSSTAGNGKMVFLFTDETQKYESIVKDGVFANITFKVKTKFTTSTVKFLELGAVD